MIETKDLLLKKAEFRDWKDMYYNVWRHAETAKYMFWNVTTNEADAQARMERTIAFEATHPTCFLVYLKPELPAIGFAGMEEVESGVFEDCGIALGPNFVGKGYGKQILQGLMELAKSLGGREFICSNRSENVASRAMQLSCGLSYCHSESRTDPRTGAPCVLEFHRKKL